MKTKYFPIFLFVSILYFITGCQKLDKNQIKTPIAEKGILNLSEYDFSQTFGLEGEWEFYANELLNPQDSTTWKNLKKHYQKVPSTWNEHQIDGKKLSSFGYGTYKLVIILPHRVPTLALKLLSFGTAYEIYINGRFVGKNGKVGNNKESYEPYMLPQIIPFTNYTEKIEILIHIANFDHKDGGFWNEVRLGDANIIQIQRDKLVAIDLILTGCFMIMAVYHLGMFLLRRKDLAAFYFSWVNFFFALRTLLTDEKYLLHLFPTLSWDFTYRLESISIYAALIFYVMFFRAMYKDDFARWSKNILVGISLLLITVIITTNPYIFSEALSLGYFLLILAGIYGLYVLRKAMLNQKLGAGALLFGFLVLFSAVLNDILNDFKVIHTIALSSYGLLAFAFLQSFALSVRYAKAFTEVEELSTTLERKVENRTADLNEKTKIIERKNEALETQKNLIQKKNESTSASINYASRIQQAILGSPEAITSNFKESFIFLQPRDVVSGDFYWFTEVKRTGTNAQGEDNKTLFFKVIAAGDCTGHGIPGAFMTVLANTLLDEIINENRITQPAKILSLLDRKLLMKLQKQGVNDGMDIGVLIFDDENKKVTFSGANNGMYYIRNGELHQVDAAKCPIGGDMKMYKDKKKFENKVIDYEEGDIFYLFSDGYQDQFGGKDNLKYYKKNFRNFLLSISHLPLKQQREELLNEHLRWRSGQLQTDDILVIGIKV
ncbi:MAG: hypothetical protein EAZ06_04990 [Cytophagales bacterium]|nr:MAG: hypothetical protein EAZ06_04990 [Cytophagales bacterium]